MGGGEEEEVEEEEGTGALTTDRVQKGRNSEYKPTSATTLAT